MISRKTVWVVLIAVFAVAFWWYRLFEPAADEPYHPTLANVDHFAANYPAATGVVRQIADGGLPLWNPYQMAGFPVLATVVIGALYPLNAFYLVLPIEWAIEATVVLHLFLAGFFSFLYLRFLGIARPAAAVGGLVFMLSGFVANQAAWFTPTLNAAVWLPVLMLGLERLARPSGAGAGAVALVAVATAMPVLAGWLQSWVYSMYAAGLYTAFHLVRLWSREGFGRSLRFASSAGVGLVLGLGLAAPLLLSAFELQRLSPRAPGGLSVDQLLLFAAYTPGMLASQMLDVTPAFPRMAYVGVLSVLLAPLSLLAAPRLPVVFWWVVVVLSALVSLTVATPVFDLFLQLPTVGWFRLPHRILFLTAFGTACLVATALDVAGRDPAEISPRSRALAGLLVVLLAALIVGWDGAPALVRSYVLLGCITVSMLLLVPARWVRGVLVAVLALFLVAEMFRASANTVHHPAHGLEPLTLHQPIWDFLRERQGYARTYVHASQFFDFSVTPKQGTLQSLYFITDYEPLNLQRYERFYNALGPHPENAPFAGSLRWDPSWPHADLISLLGVRFVVVHQLAVPFWKALSKLDPGWRQVHRPEDGKPGWSVLEHGNPFPRAYTVSRPLLAADEDEAFGLLTSKDFDPRREVVLEAGEGWVGEVGAEDGAGEGEAIIPAQIVDYQPTRVVVEVRAERPGFAVLSDTFYPGWRAEVDGREVPILRANYLFRAVPIGAGEHRIVFRYEPASFRTGASASAASLAVLAVWGGLSWRSRRLPTPA